MRVLNEKELLFCKLVAKGKDPAEAYVEAKFPGPCGMAAVKQADELRQDPDIVEQIEEYQGMDEVDEDLSSITEISRDVVIKQLWKNYMKAKDAGEFAAANRALELIGREMGMFEKAKKGPGAGIKSVSQMSTAELQAALLNKANATRNSRA